jgi:hypothetical protein
MPKHFPKGFVCTQELRDLYPDLERQMLPLIKAKANRLRRLSGFDFDDALQEGRMALLNAMTKYDYNRGKNGLERYVGRVLTNTYNALLFEHMAQCRMPQVVMQLDNEWVKAPMPPVSLDVLIGFEPEADYNDPEQEVAQNQLSEIARVFRLKMFNSLEGRDLDVFSCKVNPPMDLLIMVRNMGGNYNKTPSNVHIARYLGVSKNAIDHSLYNIRMKFVQMSRQKEFSDLLGDVVKGKGWTMIHISWEERHDVEFIQRVLAERELDPKPMDKCHQHNDYLQQVGDDLRLVERYPWGCIMFMKYKGECATLVVEGELNLNTGVVWGAVGAREPIPVTWYRQLARKLKGGK